MEAQKVNRITLLPKNEEVNKHVVEISAVKVKVIFVIVIAFTVLSTLFNFGVFIRDLCYLEPYKKSLFFICSDIGRIILYLIVYFSGRLSSLFQSILISFFPLIYSIMVTEISMYTDNEGIVIIRVLSGTCIFLIIAKYTMYNFIYTMIPFVISYVYPFVRVNGNFLVHLIDNSTLLLLPMFNVIFATVTCAYSLRRSVVEDLCGLYISKKVNDQWMQTMNMLSSGKLILSNKVPLKILYYNMAFAELIKKANGRDDSNIDDEIDDIIETLIVKGFRARSDGRKEDIKIKLVEFIKTSADSDHKDDYKYFIDSQEYSIEVKANKLIYYGEEAYIISFLDCSSVRELEKTQIESKYKTILISSISHELRSPVNYILNALDLVSNFLPSDSMSLLEMSKECCNMIIAHINDLTVISLIKIGLWKII